MSCISLYQAKELISCVNRPIICKKMTVSFSFLMFPICYQSDPQDPWIYYWVGFDGTDAMEIMQLCNITYQLPILHYDSTTELANIIKPLVDLNTASISDSYFALGSFMLFVPD